MIFFFELIWWELIRVGIRNTLQRLTVECGFLFISSLKIIAYKLELRLSVAFLVLLFRS